MTTRTHPLQLAIARWGARLATTVVTAMVPALLIGSPASASEATELNEATFTGHVNAARATRDIPPLATQGHLVAVAREQAARMASRNTLYHNPSLTSDVHNWRWVGENVGYGPTATTIHAAFIDSPAHKANILDRDYTEIGVGVAIRDGRIWVAQVFRQPARATTTSAHPLSSQIPQFEHTLRLGSRGLDVERVQSRLGLIPTGHFNRETRAAVLRFQRQQGWAGRGNCGPVTWSQLF